MKDVTPVNPIAVYQKIEGMDLPTLQVTYAELPDIETEEGYAFISAGVKEMKRLVSAVEKARKAEKAQILIDGRAVDAEAKKIDTLVRGLSLPYIEAKKEYDGRKQREKEKLEAEIQEKLAAMRGTVERAVNQSSSIISDLINEVGEVDVSHGFYAHTSTAAKLRDETLSKLTEMLGQAIQAEQAAAELEALRKEKEKQKQEMLDDKHEMALMANQLWDIKQAEAKKILADTMKKEADDEKVRQDKIKKDRQKREEEIATQAAADAEKVAEEAAIKAEEDRIQAGKDAAEATKKAAKQAEIDKQAALDKAKIESDKRAKQAEKDAAEKARREADKIESDRLKKIADDKAELDRKEKNKKHMSMVLGEIKNSLMEVVGMDEQLAIKTTKALAGKKIARVSVDVS